MLLSRSPGRAAVLGLFVSCVEVRWDTSSVLDNSDFAVQYRPTFSAGAYTDSL